nr:MAG TPA: hypothetical protein [Caudoviricetes sp.]
MIDTDIRNRLKAEIMSLTDEQVEYVISRLHDVQNEMSINDFAGKVDSIGCDLSGVTDTLSLCIAGALQEGELSETGDCRFYGALIQIEMALRRVEEALSCEVQAALDSKEEQR